MFVELILRETGSSMVPPRTVSSQDRWRHIGKASADRDDGKEKETLPFRNCLFLIKITYTYNVIYLRVTLLLI